MSRLFFGAREPIDEHILKILYEYVDVAELKRKKPIIEILKEDILPLFPNIVINLSQKEFTYLRKSGILDKAGNVRAFGKGYFLGLISQVELR